MKIFNDKHNVVIETYFSTTINGLKEGELAPHNQMVSSISFFAPHHIGEQEVYKKIYLTKDMILDLADHIKKIETGTTIIPFSNLPF